MKKILGLILCVLMAVPAAFAGCGGSGGSDNTFVVSYYNGGYGSEWLKQAADSFGAQKGIKVRLVAEADYDCGASVKLTSGKNLPDLYIASSGTWREWVTKDYLEDLTDVYEAYTSVTDSSLKGYSSENGGQIKIKDYLDQRFIDYPYMQKRMGTGDFKPWVLQWSVQPCGFAYNTDILYATVHNDKNGKIDGVNTGAKWNRFPEKVSELITYFLDIDDNNAANTYGGNKIQLGWSGVQADTLFGMIRTWWAQSQGVNTSNYEGEGTFFDFFNYGNTTDGKTEKQTFSSKVFEQTGLVKAYETLQSIIVDTENKTYKNSDSQVQGMRSTDAQAAFIKGNYAVIPASSWLEYEERDFLDTDKDGKNDINFVYHPIVSLDDYSGTQYTYCKIGDIMFVPSKAKNKELAKEFLVYLSSEENNMTFSKITGSVKPFQYNPIAKAPDHNWTVYTKSVFETFYEDTTELIYNYPKNTEKDLVSVLYRYHAYDFIAETSVSTWLQSMKTKTAAEVAAYVRSSAYTSVGNVAGNYRMDVID